MLSWLNPAGWSPFVRLPSQLTNLDYDMRQAGFDWQQKLTKIERDALWAYTHGGHSMVNKHLRSLRYERPYLLFTLPMQRGDKGYQHSLNDALAHIGYDGIRFPGSWVNLWDSDKQESVDFMATMIFPGSVHKLTNALSGTPEANPGRRRGWR